jgi:hypothetical protein
MQYSGQELSGGDCRLYLEMEVSKTGPSSFNGIDWPMVSACPGRYKLNVRD